MIAGQNGGASDSHTLDSAAAAIDSLFSAKPEEKETETATTTPTETETETQPVAAAETESDNEGVDTDEVAETEQGDDLSDVAEGEESTEKEQPKPRTFKVKVADEEIEVPEDELLKGYSRTADYTRKTQALSEEKRAVTEKAQRYASGLAEIETLLRSQMPTEPDWATLKNGDPTVFASTWAAWQQHQQDLSRVETERAAVLEHLQAESASQRKSRLESEAKELVRVIPEWTNAEVAKAEQAKLVAHAKSRGFAPEDLAQIEDHRIVAVLRDAMLYRESVEKAKTTAPVLQKKLEKVKTASPGPAAAQKRVVSETTKRKQRLAKTGRVEDAAAVIASMLE